MLIMFAELHPVGGGGLVTLHDSGGERQLLVDLAADKGVPLTELSEATVEALEEVLDPELPAVNPLDAWSRGGPDAREQMTRCLALMMQDENAALGAVVQDRAPDGKIYQSYLGYMQRARAESGKPVVLVPARQGTGHDAAVVTSTHAGYPVLDGVSPFLAGVHALFNYRDFQLRGSDAPQAPDTRIVERWLAELNTGVTLPEVSALEMLADFGVASSSPLRAGSADEAVAAAREISYPVVIKSAREGLLHKSDHGGVILGINDDEQLRQMYAVMSARLGDDVIVSAMAPVGVEMFLGVKRDPQFGPVVLIGFGGVLAETIADVQFALPPFDAEHARRCVDRMKLRPLLDGVRGSPAVDVNAFCETASRFSAMVHALADVLSEVDVNPVVVHDEGVIAVDALVAGRDRRSNDRMDV